jgi:hypothetical protein
MPTTKERIRGWLDIAQEKKAAFMIVMTDRFSYDDFPVYVIGAADPVRIVEQLMLKNENAFLVMECYKISMDWTAQLAEVRAQNWL